jgi:hypothetical protein
MSSADNATIAAQELTHTLLNPAPAAPFATIDNDQTSTDLFLALALAIAFFTPCSAILTQSYGKSIRQFWLMFA